MDSTECPCFSDEPRGIQNVGEAFKRQWFKDKSRRELLHRVADWHPDGATGAIINIARTCGASRPKCRYGEHKHLGIDDMVEIARIRLLEAGGLKFHPVSSIEELATVSDAEIELEKYRYGQCIDCPTLIRDSKRDDENGKKQHRRIRSILAQFDLNGVPLPSGLRSWSAESRFQRPPPREGGRPRGNWLRDVHVIHTAALLCFMTAKDAGRNADRGKPPGSPLSAVAWALQQDQSTRGISFNGLRAIWSNKDLREDGRPVGPALLEAWKTQDSVSS